MESPFFSWYSLSFWKAGSWVKAPLPSMIISQVFLVEKVSSPWFSEGLFDTDWLWQNKSEFSKWEEGQKLRKNIFHSYLPDLYWCNAPQLVMMKRDQNNNGTFCFEFTQPFMDIAPCLLIFPSRLAKGCFKSEETRGFLPLQDKYSKSLSWAENLNFPSKTVNNLFKFSPQESDLEYLFWRC